MATITLRQGDFIANLSEVAYRPAEGFQQENTWQVVDESISAASDVKLKDGEATIQYNGTEFPVSVSVLEFEATLSEEDEPQEEETACVLEIGSIQSLPKMALALGLLDHLSPKQQQAIAG